MEKHLYDELAEKAGGRFKLAVLVQKRIREIIKSGTPVHEKDNKHLINLVLQEIKEGKIELIDGPPIASLKKRESDSD